MFSARAARALGWDVTLVTNLPADYDQSALEGLTLVTAPVPSATRYENRYDSLGRRTQLLLSHGLAIGPKLLDRLPAGPPDLLLVAPAYHELRTWPPIGARYRAVALQGLLRTTDAGGAVRPSLRPWLAARPLAQPGTFVFFSEEDCLTADALGGRGARAGATVTVTRGRRGVSLFQGRERRDFAAYPAREVDPTGAGDCYATAFLVRFVETGSLDQALAYGLAAGALAVQARGIAGVPERGAIDELIHRVAA